MKMKWFAGIQENEMSGSVKNLFEQQPTGLKIDLVDITPAMASEMLQRLHPNQRFVNKRHVQVLVSAMLSGEWQQNAQPILFDEHGRLVDGQHRLQACVISCVTLRQTIVGKVGEAALDTIDTTRKTRTAADVAHMCGPVGATVRPNRSIITGLAMESVDFNLRYYHDLSVQTKAALFHKYTQHEQLLPVVTAATRNRLCCPENIGAVIRMARESGDAFAFYEAAFCNAPGAAPQAQLLHNTLSRLHAKKVDQHMAYSIAWSMLRAYVAWRRRETMLLLRPPPNISSADLKLDVVQNTRSRPV